MLVLAVVLVLLRDSDGGSMILGVTGLSPSRSGLGEYLG